MSQAATAHAYERINVVFFFAFFSVLTIVPHPIGYAFACPTNNACFSPPVTSFPSSRVFRRRRRREAEAEKEAAEAAEAAEEAEAEAAGEG